MRKRALHHVRVLEVDPSPFLPSLADGREIRVLASQRIKVDVAIVVCSATLVGGTR